MQVATTRAFPASPEAMWPLLCNSRMAPGQSSPLFDLGLPQPEQCRLKEGVGGVGATRECISDQGTVRQEIVTWEPPTCLSFQMRETDIYFERWVESIVETFTLVETPDGCEITRTTDVEVRGWCGLMKHVMLRVGLWKIHRFVFDNWRQQVSQAA